MPSVPPSLTEYHQWSFAVHRQMGTVWVFISRALSTDRGSTTTFPTGFPKIWEFHQIQDRKNISSPPVPLLRGLYPNSLITPHARANSTEELKQADPRKRLPGHHSINTTSLKPQGHNNGLMPPRSYSIYDNEIFSHNGTTVVRTGEFLIQK